MSRQSSLVFSLLAGLIGPLAIGCAGSSGSSSTGGNKTQGGSQNQGGSPATGGGGGGQNTGGSGNNGGSPTTGGAKGGTPTTGGAATNGGSPTTGGAKGGTPATGGAATNGGSPTGGTAGSTGGTTTVGNRPNGCPVSPEMISDFEEGPGTPVVLSGTGINGSWEAFHNDAANGAVGSQTMTVESSGDTADCKKFALHTSGTGWGGWVGIGLTNLAGTDKAPLPYNAATKNYTGIKFRAKVGAGHKTNSPVRFNISTPDTEGTGSGGKCTEGVATTEKAKRPCYQHVGRFMMEDYELSTTWKEHTFCFDRDLYPLSLPSNLTNAQRDAVAANMLKIQFQFNQAKDWSVSSYPTEGKYTKIPITEAFDFWVDDLQFFTGACPEKNFASSSGTANPFPQNKVPAGGSCGLATNANKYSTAISQIYARWTKNFVRADGSNLRVIAPEQENGVTTSEAMGYGMMITAAMGDKAAFDKMWGYVQGKLSGGLMGWKPGDSGSATDGDEDIAYGLLMAGAQWGGDYKAKATEMATAIRSKDVDANNVIKGGSGWEGNFNPSYFAPAAYRKFGSSFDAVISKGYQLTNANISAPTAGLPTDWADRTSGSPADKGNAQVISQLPGIVYGYDGARVPWRLGLDACTGGASDAKASLEKMVAFFAPKYDGGDSIDLLKAGWTKSSGQVASTAAKDMQGSFIGPMGVAGMAAGGSTGDKIRDRAFRTMLDILDYGDFNHTYFPSTVGFLTLLLMSGNFPTP